jgi:hypothetical protein
MNLSSLIMPTLEDPRVVKWIDERITKALDVQRDQLFGKIEDSGAGVINSVSGEINRSTGSITQAFATMTNSIVDNIVSQIRNLIPFHLLPGPQGKTGR